MKRGLRQSRRYRNYRSPALLAEGLVLWRGGNREKARMRFAESIEAASQLGGRLMLAEAYYEAGRCLLEEEDQQELASSHLENALMIARDCELRPYTEQISGLLGTESIDTATRSQILSL
jgi:hypothetical protein